MIFFFFAEPSVVHRTTTPNALLCEMARRGPPIVMRARGVVRGRRRCAEMFNHFCPIGFWRDDCGRTIETVWFDSEGVACTSENHVSSSRYTRRVRVRTRHRVLGLELSTEISSAPATPLAVQPTFQLIVQKQISHLNQLGRF